MDTWKSGFRTLAVLSNVKNTFVLYMFSEQKNFFFEKEISYEHAEKNKNDLDFFLGLRSGFLEQNILMHSFDTIRIASRSLSKLKLLGLLNQIEPPNLKSDHEIRRRLDDLILMTKIEFRFKPNFG